MLLLLNLSFFLTFKHVAIATARFSLYILESRLKLSKLNICSQFCIYPEQVLGRQHLLEIWIHT